MGFKTSTDYLVNVIETTLADHEVHALRDKPEGKTRDQTTALRRCSLSITRLTW